MNIKLLSLIAFLFVLASGCASTPVDQPDATAQSGEALAAADAEQAAEDPNDPNRIVCKSVKKTGTRTRTQVCATAREWEESERNAKKATSEIQRRSLHGTEGG